MKYENNPHTPKLEDIIGNQLGHYLDLSLRTLLKTVGFKLLRLRIIDRYRCLNGNIDDLTWVPILRIEAANLDFGAISYREVYPRYIAEKSEVNGQSFNDAIIRLSIKTDGYSFYSPCWIELHSNNGIIRPSGARIDWDIIERKELVFAEKGRVFANTTSSAQLFYDAAIKWFRQWMLNGIGGHEDF